MINLYPNPRARLAGASALAICLALASQAQAQQAAEVGEVVVTGSRVARAGFLAPTPTTVVSGALLNASPQTAIGAVLNNLPTFKGDYSQASAGPRSFDAPGASFANLRSLGSSRTLVLVDGRRVVPSSPSGQTDLNIIPSIMIDRVDVVTGGASAAYGSDAVAGVVNIQLKHRLQGVIGNASYGQSSHRDGKDTLAALAWGSSFAGGKGHVLIGGEYDKNKGAGSAMTRKWGTEEWGITANPVAGATPANLLVPNYRYANITTGGMVQSGPLKGLTFLPNGQTGQFQYGTAVGPSFMSGGDGYGQVYTTQLVDPLNRKTVSARLDYEFSPSTSVYAEAAWAKSATVALGASVRDTAAITVQRTNPYLPASVVALMTTNNLTTLPVGRFDTDLGPYVTDVWSKVQRYVVGAEGRIGDTWSWDAYAQYGRTRYKGDVLNSRNQANFRLAADAALNPAGQIVCRSTLTAPTNGCVPINIFGSGSPSAAAKAYVMGDQHYMLTYGQSVEAFNLHGEPFSTWAGKVSVAAGVEHRHEKAHAESDANSIAGNWSVANQKPIDGTVSVTEGYLEAVTPLLADTAFAKLVEVDTAVRLTDYSTSGRATTWKVGLNYELNDQIRLRATRSRDIRAANITELFTQGVSANVNITNPVTRVSNTIPNTTIGNPALEPEKADTTTLGVVLKPRFIPGLDISVDHYDIDLKKAISALTGQQIVNFCLGGTNPALCPFVAQANGVITGVTLARVNVASLKTRGFDFEVRYRTGLESLFGPKAGSLTMQWLGTQVDRLVVDDRVAVIDYVGEVGSNLRGAYGMPKWRWTTMATYDNGPFSFTGTVRYMGKAKINATWTTAQIADNGVASMTTVDLAARYDIYSKGGRMVQLYGTVQNLFNTAPPVVPTQISPTNPVFYETLGLAYRAGVRFSF